VKIVVKVLKFILPRKSAIKNFFKDKKFMAVRGFEPGTPEMRGEGVTRLPDASHISKRTRIVEEGENNERIGDSFSPSSFPFVR